MHSQAMQGAPTKGSFSASVAPDETTQPPAVAAVTTQPQATQGDFSAIWKVLYKKPD